MAECGECPVCRARPATQPLHDAHRLCLPCLLNVKTNRNELRCPSCRHVLAVKRDGLFYLPKDPRPPPSSPPIEVVLEGKEEPLPGQLEAHSNQFALDEHEVLELERLEEYSFENHSGTSWRRMEEIKEFPVPRVASPPRRSRRRRRRRHGRRRKTRSPGKTDAWIERRHKTPSPKRH